MVLRVPCHPNVMKRFRDPFTKWFVEKIKMTPEADLKQDKVTDKVPPILCVAVRSH